jgi:hypothetical protein
LVSRHHTVLAQVSLSYSVPKGRFPRVTHPCATRPEGLVRLACVRHAASVRSEPGSNSQVHDRNPIPTGKSRPKQNPVLGAYLSAQRFNLAYLASDCSEAMCFVVTFRGHISSVFNHRDRTLNCPDGGPPPTCPFIQPTMRKSDTGLPPEYPGSDQCLFFEVGSESRRKLVVGDGGGLWAVRKTPSTTFFQIFSGQPGVHRKSRHRAAGSTP